MESMSEQEAILLKAQQGYEQLAEALRTMIAPLVASYFNALVAAGVPVEAAAVLADSVQELCLTPFARAFEASA